MAFDWIAGTALVVGVGSLYLTYQSTKSAKRAIDTSIELYEKQKKDSNQEKESANAARLESVKSVFRYEIARNYANYRSMLNTFNTIRYCDDVYIHYEKLGFGEIMAHSPSADAHNFKVYFRPICEDIDVLCDIMLLDKKIALSLISLNQECVRLSDTLEILVNLFRNKGIGKVKARDTVRVYLSDFDVTFERYGDLMEKLYKECGGNKTLSSLYEDIANKYNAN
ncbi:MULTISPECIES: hypothetical protein [unclassified Providencia]|uniref:hypothetical protein n=1 Tax=unclassified Providencia TaxID=2633465 RepID=UPI002348F49F|nr:MULTISPECIES: hypothetical protein [unclassified Providencia]